MIALSKSTKAKENCIKENCDARVGTVIVRSIHVGTAYVTQMISVRSMPTTAF